MATDDLTHQFHVAPVYVNERFLSHQNPQVEFSRVNSNHFHRKRLLGLFDGAQGEPALLLDPPQHALHHTPDASHLRGSQHVRLILGLRPTSCVFSRMCAEDIVKTGGIAQG